MGGETSALGRTALGVLLDAFVRLLELLAVLRVIHIDMFTPCTYVRFVRITSGATIVPTSLLCGDERSLLVLAGHLDGVWL